MAIRDHYLGTVAKKFAHYGAWLPNTIVSIGDIGVLNASVFSRHTSLKELGVPFSVRKGGAPLTFRHDVSAGLEMRLDASLPEPARNAELSIQFGNAGAFLFHASECFVDELDDRGSVATSVANLSRINIWQPHWVLVDTVVRASSATILIANSNGSRIELRANTQIDCSNLADPRIGLSVSSQKGDVTLFVAQRDLTPLFKLARYKHSWMDRVTRKPAILRFGGKRDLALSDDAWEQLEP